MKTTLSAPAPDEGSGLPTGGTPAAIRKGNELKAAALSGPRYDDGETTYNGGARYVVGVGTAPISDGARVKMMLDRRSNDNLQSFVGNHITMMTGNASFTTPNPPAADLLALLTDYQTKLAAWVEADAIARDASAVFETARTALTVGMQARGAYVQTASNGNRDIILSSGLEVANPRTPLGPLPPPINIRIDLNGIPGVMKMRWEPVYGARGYLVECSEDVTPRVWTQIKNSTKASLYLENMEVGTTYVFRIATQGGSTGQSPWSAEVIRGAA